MALVSAVVVVMAAAVEFRAKQEEPARAYLQQALQHSEHPLPVWLLLSSYGVRMGFAAEWKKEFNQKFKDVIAGPPDSFALGRVAGTLVNFRKNRLKYTGLPTQNKLFVASVQKAIRSTKMVWREADLETVAFYFAFSHEPLPYKQLAMLKGLLEKGVREHPNNPMLHFLLAKHLVSADGMFCDPQRVAGLLERALEVNAKAERSLNEEQLNVLRSLLESLPDASSSPFGFINDDEDFYDDEEDDFYDDEEDEEFDAAGAKQALEAEMPPEMIGMMEAMFAKQGLTLEQVMEMIANGEGPPEEMLFAPDETPFLSFEPEEEEPQTQRTSRKKAARRKTTKKKKRRGK